MILFLRSFGLQNFETRWYSAVSRAWRRSKTMCHTHTDPGSVFFFFTQCLWNHSSDADLTIPLSPAALKETRAPICKHPRLFTRVRRSRFPHMQPTTLHLQLPPTLLLPVRAACTELWRSRFTPCLVFRSHDSRSLKIHRCHYLGRLTPELCVHSLVTYYKWVLIV